MTSANESLINTVWEKASIVKGFNPDMWRKDFAGAWLLRDQFGLSSDYGWDICLLVPASHGGTNDIDNLYPIQWENQRRKSNHFPVFKTAVTAKGEKNVHMELLWKIQE